MSITAKELARILNLSETAISLALRGKPGVSTKTRQLVLKTAEAHGYDFSKTADPNHLKGPVCLVLYKKHNAIISYTPIFDEMIDSVRTVTHARHIDFKTIQFYEQMDTLQSLFDEILGSGCVGIILVGTEIEESVAKRFTELSIPVVILDSYFHQLKCDSVSINNRTGAYTATDYLIRHLEGAGTPGHLMSSYRINNFDERREGFLDAIHESGISEESCPSHMLAPSFEGAMTDMLRVIDSGKKLADGYFADNDIIAIGAIKALKVRGFRIPEDVSVIGFDNISEGHVIDPSLTTMDVPRRIIAEHAVRQLLHRIKNPADYPVRIQIAPRLVKRFSL